MYRLDLLLRQQQNAFDPIVIIIELSYRIVYRDNFDLSYRLSIGNSIWHIVTALLTVKHQMKTQQERPNLVPTGDPLYKCKPVVSLPRYKKIQFTDNSASVSLLLLSVSYWCAIIQVIRLGNQTFHSQLLVLMHLKVLVLVVSTI